MKMNMCDAIFADQLRHKWQQTCVIQMQGIAHDDQP